MSLASYSVYGDGSTDEWVLPITFPSYSSLLVYIDNVLQNTGYTHNTVPNSVTFDTAPTGGSLVVFLRDSQVAPIKVYSSGAVFTARNVDAVNTQVEHLISELKAVATLSTADPVTGYLSYGSINTEAITSESWGGI